MRAGTTYPFYLVALLTLYAYYADAFTTPPIKSVTRGDASRVVATTTRLMAQISEKEANAAIAKVVDALRKDKEANGELGRLSKTNNVLGFGSPRPGIVAVRFRVHNKSKH